MGIYMFMKLMRTPLQYMNRMCVWLCYANQAYVLVPSDVIVNFDLIHDLDLGF